MTGSFLPAPIQLSGLAKNDCRGYLIDGRLWVGRAFEPARAAPSLSPLRALSRMTARVLHSSHYFRAAMHLRALRSEATPWRWRPTRSRHAQTFLGGHHHIERARVRLASRRLMLRRVTLLYIWRLSSATAALASRSRPPPRALRLARSMSVARLRQ